MTINQQQLDHYFSKIWAQQNLDNLDTYIYTGWKLVDKIQDGERVLDVGCGQNHFKNHISNLVAIDPAFDAADYKMTLEQFAQLSTVQPFDVAFCLGSINFGNQADIERQIGLVVGLLHEQHSRIYWRSNPGLTDHNNNECHAVPFYHWSFEEHERLSAKFGYQIIDMQWDYHNRIYAEWVSKNSSRNQTIAN
jgi:hypothetical protein